MDIASMRPDLLITDLSMPGVDGIEMLKALKRNSQLADMQIIVISGLPADAIEARGGLPPHAHLLQKPINFDWLQGYMAAMVTANIKWRNPEPRVGKRVTRSVAAESTFLPAQLESGLQDDGG